MIGAGLISSQDDHLLNRVRNALFFGLRYPWVKRGNNVHVQWTTFMWSPHRDISLGNDVSIGAYCFFQADVAIGNKVMIASHVSFIGSDDHRFDEVGKTMWDSGRGDSKKTIVEDDVWIGHGSTILGGARIGRGSIIAAGAVVVGAVEPYSIMVPQKARVLRRRFDEAQIREHEAELERRRGR